MNDCLFTQHGNPCPSAAKFDVSMVMGALKGQNGLFTGWELIDCIQLCGTFTLHLNQERAESYCPLLFWSQSLFLSRSVSLFLSVNIP